MTLRHAVLIAIVTEWGIEWLAWKRSPVMPLGDWPLVAARAVLSAAIGVFEVYRDRRWVEAALAAGSAALAAIVAVSISGRMNGTFLAPGIAPAILAAKHHRYHGIRVARRYGRGNDGARDSPPKRQQVVGRRTAVGAAVGSCLTWVDTFA